MENRGQLADGFRKVYQGQLVMLVSAVAILLAALLVFTIILIPLSGLVGLVAGIASIVGWVIWIMGIYGCKSADDGYAMSFNLILVGIVLAVLNFFTAGILSFLISIASSVVGAAVIFYFVQATRGHLRNQTTIDKGDTTVRIVFITVGLGIVASLLALIILPLGALLGIVNAILGIAQVYFYITYLKDASAEISG